MQKAAVGFRFSVLRRFTGGIPPSVGRPWGRGLYSATVVSGDTGEHRNSKGRYASLSLRGLGDATSPKGSGLVKEPKGRIMHGPF
jgi:hypothetical protein